MVEAALIMPLAVLLVMGIVEFGLLFRGHHSVSSASGAGAREAASHPRDSSYRDLTLTAIDQRLSALTPHDGDTIVLFKVEVEGPPTSPDDPDYGTPYDYPVGTDSDTPPTECERECVTWIYEDGNWVEQDPDGSPGINWPARDDDPAFGDGANNEEQCALAGHQDYFGVHLELTYEPTVPLLGGLLDDHVIRHTTIARLEPYVPLSSTDSACPPGGAEY